jgi:hypothetical protein
MAVTSPVNSLKTGLNNSCDGNPTGILNTARSFVVLLTKICLLVLKKKFVLFTILLFKNYFAISNEVIPYIFILCDKEDNLRIFGQHYFYGIFTREKIPG